MSVKTILSLICLFYLSPSLALTLNGNTSFASVIHLNSAVSGVVESVKVKAGQHVKKGDVLLVLNNIPYKARLDRAIANEKSLMPAVQTAEMELERASELYDRDSLSQVALKKAEMTLAQAEGAHQVALAEVVLARYQLSNSIIYSPVDGYVLEFFANRSMYVDPAVSVDPLLTLVENHLMKAVALINSDQWSPSLMNKEATIQYRNKPFNGKVNYLGSRRVQQSSGLPAYEIHVVFESDILMPAEMPVIIQIKD